MDEAIERYKERRRARIDAKTVERYRIRRDARRILRLDADGDESENNNSGGGKKGGGGHGNLRIPFGLCQREGIKIEPGWTPKDAWDALAGKGYSAGEVYKQLKDTGKAGKPSKPVAPAKPKKAPTKLAESHFPSEFLTTSHKKNTMMFAKFINDHCEDAETSEFLSAVTGAGAKRPPQIKMVKTSLSGKGEVVTWSSPSTGRISKTDIKIPNLAAAKTEGEKAQAVRVFAHEWTHFLDLCARPEDKYGHFSDSFTELRDKLKTDDGHYGEEVKKLFTDFNKQYDEMRKEESAEKSRASVRAANEYFAKVGGMPAWLSSDGRIDWIGAHRAGQYRQAEEYEKLAKKARKEVEDAYDLRRRAIMDGVSNLQGMYDSMSGGKLSRVTHEVKYGHPTEYFRKDPKNKGIELIADYVALKATNPALVEVFRKDRPEIAEMLDRQIVDMAKRLRGES